MIKFSKVKKEIIDLSTKVYYNEIEESIESIPMQNNDISILIAYLEIGFDALTMTAVSFSGFSPKYSWINKNIELPNFTNGLLKIENDIDEGSWRIDRDDEWKVYFDDKTEWLLVTSQHSIDNKDDSLLENFMFMNNVIASISLDGYLKNIYAKIS